MIELDRESFPGRAFQATVVELGRRHGLDCSQTALVLPQACTYFTSPGPWGEHSSRATPPSSKFLRPRCILFWAALLFRFPSEPCGPALCRLDPLRAGGPWSCRTPAWTVDDVDDGLGGHGLVREESSRSSRARPLLRQRQEKKLDACPLTRTGRTCTYRVARVRDRQGWWCSTRWRGGMCEAANATRGRRKKKKRRDDLAGLSIGSLAPWPGSPRT